MKCLILCGGSGVIDPETRSRIPKALMQVGGAALRLACHDEMSRGRRRGFYHRPWGRRRRDRAARPLPEFGGAGNQPTPWFRRCDLSFEKQPGKLSDEVRRHRPELPDGQPLRHVPLLGEWGALPPGSRST
jgi:hypothetical protein